MTRRGSPRRSARTSMTTRLHLGLPTGALVDVVVRWPDGSRSEHRRLAPDGHHRLQRP
ncbi:MAG: ASPIC/UnbV domain-containing protein [Myxococcales bacterium]|nr:ASPIC/UnbV domain-containing protein [Myxococcales bacterium]MCB9627503.1 ASPIC/UnbV domain-containing protein [Sandaracinaceae bacterium]